MPTTSSRVLSWSGLAAVAVGVVLLHLSLLDLVPRHPGWLCVITGAVILYWNLLDDKRAPSRLWGLSLPLLFGVGCWLVLRAIGIDGRPAELSLGLLLTGLGAVGGSLR